MKKYKAAQLPPLLFDTLRDLEFQLSKISGREILLVAYEEIPAAVNKKIPPTAPTMARELESKAEATALRG